MNIKKTKGFAHITYTQAIDILKKCGKTFEFPVEWGVDLQSEHEKYLTDQVFKGPVIVYNYPKAIKAFYMRNNEDGQFDGDVGEIIPITIPSGKVLRGRITTKERASCVEGT